MSRKSIRLLLALAMTSCGVQLSAAGKDNVNLVANVSHSANINALAVSSDSRLLLSGGSDSKIKLWDVETGALLRTVDGGPFDINAVGFSPDGKQFVSQTKTGKVSVWETSTGRLVRATRPSFDQFTAKAFVAFSGDGHFLVTGGPAVVLWEAESGKFLRVIDDDRFVGTAAASQDGGIIVTGSQLLGGLKIRAKSGELLQSFKEQDPINSVALSPDNKKIAAGEGLVGHGTIKVWDIATGKKLNEFDVAAGPVRSVVFSPDGMRLISSSWQNVQIWDLLKNKSVLSQGGHDGQVSSVVFSPDGRFFASAGNDRTIRVWDGRDGHLVRVIGGEHYISPVKSMAISPGGQWLVTSSLGDQAKLWNLQNGSLTSALGCISDEALAISFSPDGGSIAYDNGHEIAFCNPQSGEQTGAIKVDAARSAIRLVAFSPDGRRLVSTDFGGQITIWDRSKSEVVHQIEAHKEFVRTVVFFPDSHKIVSGAGEESIKIWSSESGKLVLSFNAESSNIKCIAVSPDSRLIVSGGYRSLKLWNAETGELIRQLGNNIRYTQAVAFSPDARSIVSGGDDGVVRLWNTETGKIQNVFQGHNAKINSIAFTPDGGRIISISDDGSTRIWSPDSKLPHLVAYSAGSNGWIILSPSYFFAGSTGGEKLLNVIDVDKISSLSGFHDKLYRPNLIAEIFKGNSEQYTRASVGPSPFQDVETKPH